MLKLRHIATLLVIMLMTAVSASAQKNIESAVAALIKKYPDAQLAYTEYRTPKTHKLERVTRTISMSDDAEYNKLLRALEADAAESVRFSKANGVVTVRFEDDNSVMTYSLVRSNEVTVRGDNWLLSITIRKDAD